MTELLKKQGFKWNDEATLAFDALKQALTTAPVLRMPNFSEMFVVECDASGFGVGAVLMQQNHPIAFMSKGLKGRQLSLSTYDRELLAILLAVRAWRQYLLGRSFLIRTDQRSIKYILDQRMGIESQNNWLHKLVDYSFKVEYKKGIENSAADGLSRREDECSNKGVTLIVPKWLDDAKSMVAQSLYFLKLKDQWRQGTLATEKYKLRNELWFYKGRVLVDANSEFCKKILHDFHSSPAGGHSGYHKTLKKVRAVFWWEGMKHTIKTFIRECDICQRNKQGNTHPAGLLQPLPISDHI